MAIRLKPILQNQSFLKKPHNKPLSALFEEVVGLKPKSETIEIEQESNELNKKLMKLEKELTELKQSEPVLEKKVKIQNLSKLFKNDDEEKKKKEEDVIRVYKELPSEMLSFVKLLHKDGYLNKANFISGEKFDKGSLDDEYSRTFVKFAAERFGKDHQEIAKWLYGSDLKNIALFGCPSLEKRAIFAAKTLRNFFHIPENSVCDKCVLKEKCKFPNQSVWDGKTTNLHLSVVMKVIMLYPLDLTHPKLQVPREVQDSVSRVLTEIQNLSRTICTPLG